jgi:hypothetical protein
MPYLLLTLMLLICPGVALAQQPHGAHQHGVAQLAVALDGGSLRIEFDTPLDNLVGFERRPRNPKEQQALADADLTLHQVELLFALPAAAACTVRQVLLTWPWPLHTTTAQPAKADHRHSELEAVYVLDCAHPQALTAIDIKLFDVFPRLRTLRTESATDLGQKAVTLDRKRRTLPL